MFQAEYWTYQGFVIFTIAVSVVRLSKVASMTGLALVVWQVDMDVYSGTRVVQEARMAFVSCEAVFLFLRESLTRLVVDISNSTIFHRVMDFPKTAQQMRDLGQLGVVPRTYVGRNVTAFVSSLDAASLFRSVPQNVIESVFPFPPYAIMLAGIDLMLRSAITIAFSSITLHGGNFIIFSPQPLTTDIAVFWAAPEFVINCTLVLRCSRAKILLSSSSTPPASFQHLVYAFVNALVASSRAVTRSLVLIVEG